MAGPKNPRIPLSQAAHRLGLSWNQAWRLVLKGVIHGEQHGGQWFVDEGEVVQKALEITSGPSRSESMSGVTENREG